MAQLLNRFLKFNLYQKGKRHARRGKRASAFLLMNEPELADAYRQGYEEASKAV